MPNNYCNSGNVDETLNYIVITVNDATYMNPKLLLCLINCVRCPCFSFTRQIHFTCAAA